MAITLNYLSDILLNFISFTSFAVVLCFYFIWDVFLCLLILSLCVCFYILGGSVMSPDLESSGFRSKRLCGALWHNVPWSLEPGASGCFLCGLRAPYSCGWATFFFTPVGCIGQFVCHRCTGQDTVPMLLRGLRPYHRGLVVGGLSAIDPCPSSSCSEIPCHAFLCQGRQLHIIIVIFFVAVYFKL